MCNCNAPSRNDADWIASSLTLRNDVVIDGRKNSALLDQIVLEDRHLELK